jgi:integrase
VRRVWREVRDVADLGDVVTHMLRKTVASVLDDAHIPVRKISDQLGHARVSMTQDRYLGRRLTDRQTAEVLEAMLDEPETEKSPTSVPAKLAGPHLRR